MPTPQAKFADVLMHPTLFEQAAAYLFPLCKNHPFVDGNKRVSIAVSLAFLAMTDIDVDATEDEMVELVVGIATGSVSKVEAALLFMRHARKFPSFRAAFPERIHHRGTETLRIV